MNGILDIFKDPILMVNQSLISLEVSSSAILVPAGIALVLAAYFAKDFVSTKRGYR